VQTADLDGDFVTWEIESSGVNYLRRLEMPLEILKVGSRVKVAGWPSKRSDVRLYGTNILSADGQEFVLWRSTALGGYRPRLCCRSLRYGRHGRRKRCHDISRVVIRFRFLRQARRSGRIAAVSFESAAAVDTRGAGGRCGIQSRRGVDGARVHSEGHA
jgi:hypothetical protein